MISFDLSHILVRPCLCGLGSLLRCSRVERARSAVRLTRLICLYASLCGADYSSNMLYTSAVAFALIGAADAFTAGALPVHSRTAMRASAKMQVAEAEVASPVALAKVRSCQMATLWTIHALRPLPAPSHLRPYCPTPTSSSAVV